jgi:hypothetical protein
MQQAVLVRADWLETAFEDMTHSRPPPVLPPSGLPARVAL